MRLSTRSPVACIAATATAGLLGCGGHHTAGAPVDAGVIAPVATREELLDPIACQGCHRTHYADWSRSMHAYASDDPVFLAMNRRGQRETNGQLGSFCVKCHAPMAVRDGKTTDGLNLAAVDAKYKGVTCFFCHSVASVDGTHNAALTLSGDLAMRGEYSDPVPNVFHASASSALFARDDQAGAKMCGSCHDIAVGPAGTPIERTFCEWSGSAFDTAASNGGQTCVQCHMVESSGAIAQTLEAPTSRKYHGHDFPGVDVALGPSLAQDQTGKAAVEQFLATSLQGALCVTQLGQVRAVIDPVFLGHDWPSGAAQDRRAWAEVVTYSGGNVIYQSGVVPDGTAVAPSASDPDLWLLRDRMFDALGNPVSMFWQAASTQGNEIPALSTFDPLDTRYYQTHVEQVYPRGSGAAQAVLPTMPDRVTFRMRLQPIGRDVLDDLVDGGDLDPSVPGAMPTFDVSFLEADGGVQSALEWTVASAQLSYLDVDQTPVTCVATDGFNVGATRVRAPPPSTPVGCPVDAGTAANDGSTDASFQCDPRFNPDTIAPGLAKEGSAHALTISLVSATPAPPGVNYDTWVVKVLDSAGQPVTDATFPQIKTWMPLHGHPSSIVPTSKNNGDGTYTISLYLFMPGLWQITVHAQTGSTADTVVFTFCVGG
jgi:YtkA-like/Cytochrome c554 and c-prime